MTRRRRAEHREPDVRGQVVQHAERLVMALARVDVAEHPDLARPVRPAGARRGRGRQRGLDQRQGDDRQPGRPDPAAVQQVALVLARDHDTRGLCTMAR